MPLLSDEQIASGLEGLDAWERAGDALRREFEFDDFVGSVEFVKRLTPVAEEMNHHPDLAISWNKVTVSLSTHSQGGITDSDLELAGKLDGLA
ncbi:MAG: 4a-hydroxytetrahydrobiopterin dehydratase [Thermoleophilaceae bacterium]